MEGVEGASNAPRLGVPAISISTEQFPTRERESVLRDIFGRHIMNVDLASLGDAPVRARLVARALPALGVAATTISSAFQAKRTADHISRGGDDVVITIMKQGAVQLFQFDRNAVAGAGDAVAIMSTEASAVLNSAPAMIDSVVLSVPRAVLSPAVRDVEAACVKQLPVQTVALLKHYLSVLEQPDALATQELQRAFTTHVHDLLTLALGATRDAAEVAKARGLRASRLQALRDDILANLHRSDLSPDLMANRHGISPRYIRLLFAGEETSFTDFVRVQRLARSYRMLTAPQYDALTISAIAFEAGFADLSHFNHAFRRAYGMTPSDVRARARKAGPA